MQVTSFIIPHLIQAIFFFSILCWNSIYLLNFFYTFKTALTMFQNISNAYTKLNKEFLKSVTETVFLCINLWILLFSLLDYLLQRHSNIYLTNNLYNICIEITFIENIFLCLFLLLYIYTDRTIGFSKVYSASQTNVKILKCDK